MKPASRSAMAEVAHLVPPTGVGSYLSRRGWRELPTAREDLANYTLGSRVILVPRSFALADYGEMILRAATLLAAMERKHVDDVLAQMLMNCDVLRVHVRSPETKHGSMPLPKAQSMIEDMRDLLIYSACAELSRTKVVRRKLKEATDFSDRCRMGPTDVGSVVATFYVPMPLAVAQAAQQSLFETVDSRPIERRIVDRLMGGVQLVSAAARASDHRVLTEAEGQPVNANMCEVLAHAFAVFPDSTWTFTASKDPAYSSYSTAEASVNAAACDIVELAAAEMRDVPVFGDVEIEGTVYSLRNAEEPDDEKNRIIRVHWEDNGAIYRVKMQLNPADYEVACDAHKRNLAIRVKGVLERVGRGWRLERPHSFSAITD